MIGNERTTSGFTLSVGTGLALETIFTPTEAVYDDTRVVTKFDVNKVDTFVVSWYTIVRNIIQSLTPRDKARVFETNKIKEVAAIANSELQVIEMLCGTYGLELIILAPDYTKSGLVLVDTSKPTSKNMIFNIARKSINEIIFEPIKKIKYVGDKKILLFSHIAMDIANTKHRNTVCLESNTGLILNPPMFHKKFRKGSLDLSFLPLFPELLVIFGDSSGLLHIASIKDKKKAYQLLVDLKATVSTSRNRIVNILERDKDIVDILRLHRFEK